MHVGDEEIDRASAGFSEFESLASVCRGQDKEISVFENLLNGLTKRFQVFDNENDRMSSGLRLHSVLPNLGATLHGLRMVAETATSILRNGKQ